MLIHRTQTLLSLTCHTPLEPAPYAAAEQIPRIPTFGHEEPRRLLLRDGDPSRPVPEITFTDRYTLQVGGERVELAWHGSNHSPDNIYIHFPGHDTLMFIDVVNAGWVPAGPDRARCRSCPPE
jgi:glyoxylase-like metal-dependent hydrolase (beta-lactamase superfamily II)